MGTKVTLLYCQLWTLCVKESDKMINRFSQKGKIGVKIYYVW